MRDADQAKLKLPTKIRSRKLKAIDLKDYAKLKVLITDKDRRNIYNSQREITQKSENRRPRRTKLLGLTR